jgi:hypothetical protein
MADNVDRGRSVQELALGVEKPRTAYAASDDEGAQIQFLCQLALLTQHGKFERWQRRPKTIE